VQDRFHLMDLLDCNEPRTGVNFFDAISGAFK
jgi:hypothetical protein